MTGGGDKGAGRGEEERTGGRGGGAKGGWPEGEGVATLGPGVEAASKRLNGLDPPSHVTRPAT